MGRSETIVECKGQWDKKFWYIKLGVRLNLAVLEGINTQKTWNFLKVTVLWTRVILTRLIFRVIATHLYLKNRHKPPWNLSGPINRINFKKFHVPHWNLDNPNGSNDPWIIQLYWPLFRNVRKSFDVFANLLLRFCLRNINGFFRYTCAHNFSIHSDGFLEFIFLAWHHGTL
jgi:hypothetical protein